MTITKTNNELSQIVNNLYNFYRVFVGSKFKTNLPAPHIQNLCRELTRLYLDKYNRMVVNMPPQHSKSSCITLAFPLWLIFQDPTLNILIVNNSAGLSERFGIELREYIREYGRLFNIYLSDVKHAKNYLMFCDKDGNLYTGSIRLVGAGASNITGTTTDYLVIDDPYGGFDDIRPSLLEKKIDWFKTIILQRIREHSKLIILHTRWATNDISGYLKEEQPTDYKFIEYPAIKSDGTPLWSEAYSIEMLNKRRDEMGERLFQAIYQQQPLDETGDFFNVEKLIFTDNFSVSDPTIDGVVRSYDCAYSDETRGNVNDRTASVLMYHTIDDRYIITQLSAGRYGEQLFNKIKSTAKIDTPNVPIVIETGTAGGSSKFLFDIYKKDLSGYNVQQSLPLTSKVDRAFGFKEAILDGKVFIQLDNKSRGLLLEEMKGFPLMKHDDIIDACSHAFNYLQHNSSNGIKTANKRRRRRL